MPAPDRHKTVQTAFRVPEGLLASAKAAADGEGVTLTAWVLAAMAEKLERRITARITAAPEPVSPPSAKRPRKPKAAEPPAAKFRQPEGASDIMAALRRRRNEGS